MNNQELESKVRQSMYEQCKKRGFATTVDVLLDLGILSQDNYNNWRRGRVPYLERVCHTNLHKLNSIRHYMRSFAHEKGMKTSYTVYKQYGAKHLIKLRFSKTGAEAIERQYATHYMYAAILPKERKTKKEKKVPDYTPHTPPVRRAGLEYET